MTMISEAWNREYFFTHTYTPEPETHIPPPMPKVELAPRIAYLCDRKACVCNCIYPECKHTSDITHAKNFQKIGCVNTFIEKEVD